MKTALICIGRCENEYAREFVTHHLAIGFDHIYIYDNNHDGEEHFETVLSDLVAPTSSVASSSVTSLSIDSSSVASSSITGDAIADPPVTIIPYRNRESAQCSAYNDAYARYGHDYDWLAFFDFDEFLILHRGTVKQWLSHAPKQAEVMLVNWQCMTDNNLVTNDHRPLMDRFTEPMPYDRCVQYDFPDNNHVKSIVRGGLAHVCFRNPHVPVTPRNPKPSPFRPYDFSKPYLRHFTTKTIEEWLTNKCRKGVGDRPMERFQQKYADRFFLINDHTPEKQHFIDTFNNSQFSILNSHFKITAAIVHYNTPKLTRATILSLWKHTPGCRVVVFDNSDRLPIADSPAWDELRHHPLITVIDNTRGQQIDFDQLLAQYHRRQFSDRNESNFGSAKHTASVDRLFDLLPDGFLLMDSDVLVLQDITPLIDHNVAATGRLRPNQGVMRLLPVLCWLNVPLLRQHHIRYFNGQKMWALSDRYPDNRYDTGAWLLEEIQRHQLPITEIVARDYILHLGHASWRSKSPMTWLREHADLWQ